MDEAAGWGGGSDAASRPRGWRRIAEAGPAYLDKFRYYFAEM